MDRKKKSACSEISLKNAIKLKNYMFHQLYINFKNGRSFLARLEIAANI